MTSTPAPNSAENPWPVRTLNKKIADWIHRLGQVWVEGQLTQINRRPGTRTAFLTLRDPAADLSLSLTCDPDLLRRSAVPLTEGARVIVYGRPDFYPGRGTLSLRITDIRPVGIGELLARIERIKALLGAEGLFDVRRKRALPFLPHTVGLISGRGSAAQRDVIAVASARWASVRFRLSEVPVQGPSAVPAIVDHLRLLDDDPEVEVIIIARGGGSVEDLLPFSDETLLRAVAACRTPVVSAIGHEPDNPLLDLVADVRAATPTDAAKRVAPEIAAEVAMIETLRSRSAHALRNWVAREQRVIDGLRARPVLARPQLLVDEQRTVVERLRADLRRNQQHRLTVAHHQLTQLSARLATLGPAQTLARGYAVVQRIDDDAPHAVSSLDQLSPGAQVRIRVADGAARAVVDSLEGSEQ
ncbi:exodeoxyribonuclease VII large subunit [Gordonia hirsuta DSM 44140 = NBRC 16056]|uniref:Exodeoxyribonuclease 7 large subunit n=1 Tax=Gordonia hirsuta DSM 44140 = NBRC 16056 TaxID=1121927 RepID=L7LFM9_9ACTN|nr:exodeoxyribonuclease VII large subunit [Gordonia hirsuta]GAC58887.1 exodeoxyribonuclease VII large subunit [Gordonia hirsuta DSM 44140 = NBRC 16056]